MRPLYIHLQFYWKIHIHENFKIGSLEWMLEENIVGSRIGPPGSDKSMKEVNFKIGSLE